jgi:hypothetical protein
MRYGPGYDELTWDGADMVRSNPHKGDMTLDETMRSEGWAKVLATLVSLMRRFAPGRDPSQINLVHGTGVTGLRRGKYPKETRAFLEVVRQVFTDRTAPQAGGGRRRAGPSKRRGSLSEARAAVPPGRIMAQSTDDSVVLEVALGPGYRRLTRAMCNRMRGKKVVVVRPDLFGYMRTGRSRAERQEMIRAASVEDEGKDAKAIRLTDAETGRIIRAASSGRGAQSYYRRSPSGRPIYIYSPR